MTWESTGAFTAESGARAGCVAKFLAHHGGVDAQLLRDLVGQFVAHDAAGDALNVRQQIVHRFLLAVSAAHGELRAGALDQVVEIFLRVAQGFAVGVFAFAADVEVGIESLFESEDLDLKLFFDQQADGALSGFGSGGVGIEVHDDVLTEAAEQLGLQLGESGAGAGDDVMKSGGEDGNAIHLAFDQDGVVELLHPFFREVEIEENLALGIDRGLGRIQIFRSGLFVGGQGASGEGDDFSRFARDGEHDAVAEFGVHGEPESRS